MQSAFSYCCLSAVRLPRQVVELRAPAGFAVQTPNWTRTCLCFFTATFCLLIVASGVTWAASPQYCKLYSREFVKIDLNDMSEKDRSMMTANNIESRYNKYYADCLSQGTDPTLPTAIIESDSYWTSYILKITNSCPPIAKQSALTTKVIPIIVDNKPPAPSLQQKLVCSHQEYSGFALGSKEQVAWCKQNYKTYNPKTGYVWCANMKRDRCS
jgi:hypothetical protein